MQDVKAVAIAAGNAIKLIVYCDAGDSGIVVSGYLDRERAELLRDSLAALIGEEAISAGKSKFVQSAGWSDGKERTQPDRSLAVPPEVAEWATKITLRDIVKGQADSLERTLRANGNFTTPSYAGKVGRHAELTTGVQSAVQQLRKALSVAAPEGITIGAVTILAAGADMLEVLKEGIEFWDDEDGDNLTEWRAKARVIIAKAEGRE